jgi:hypothetical protein
MSARPFLLALAVAAPLAAAAPPAPQVQKLWDQAPHNAFTDLIRWRDRWYCCFREGEGHAKGAGTIRVLTSADGDAWASAASIAADGVDLRDAHLTVTPAGRLMLNGGAAVPPARNPVTDHYSFVSFSDDGTTWTAPKKILDSWQWLWRVAWHKGTAYGVAYGWDPKAPARSKGYTAALYKSGDGLAYEKVTDFDLKGATEAAVAFGGDTMLCLQRRDGTPNTAQLGTSRPPYTAWEWKDLGASFGGPALLRGPDGGWLAAGRMTMAGKPQTVVARLDAAAGKLTPLVTLPSGGDTSYPGLVWHQGKLWMSYYSSHEGKSGIYLARLAP